MCPVEWTRDVLSCAFDDGPQISLCLQDPEMETSRDAFEPRSGGLISVPLD